MKTKSRATVSKSPVATRPPDNPNDGDALFRYFLSLRDNWPNPGGLNFETFSDKFLKAATPAGWKKPSYGQAAIGTKRRGDIGLGHAAFLRLHLSDGVVTAIPFPFREDRHFIPDFAQAERDWRESAKAKRPLLSGDHRPLEFKVLAIILVDRAPYYRVKRMRELMKEKFGPYITAWKARYEASTAEEFDRLIDHELDRVMKRLGIQRKPLKPST
jgi:hypothetical protein